MWPTSPEKRDSLLHSASHIRKALLGFLSVSSIGFLWAWRFCGYKTGLLFGNASGTNAQMTPSYLVDSILACITILALPPLLARMSLRGKRMLTIGGAITVERRHSLDRFRDDARHAFRHRARRRPFRLGVGRSVCTERPHLCVRDHRSFGNRRSPQYGMGAAGAIRRADPGRHARGHRLRSGAAPQRRRDHLAWAPPPRNRPTSNRHE